MSPTGNEINRGIWLAIQAAAAAAMAWAAWRDSAPGAIVFAALYLQAGAQGRQLADWHREDQRSRSGISR